MQQKPNFDRFDRDQAPDCKRGEITQKVLRFVLELSRSRGEVEISLEVDALLSGLTSQTYLFKGPKLGVLQGAL